MGGSNHAKNRYIPGLPAESLVLRAQVFIDNRRNVAEGTGADELGHPVAADDEYGWLGGDAVVLSAFQVAGDEVFVGGVFHAGGEARDVQPQGLSARNLTFDAASYAAVPECVVMVVPEGALLARTFRAEGDCARLGSQDSEVAIDHFDLAFVHVCRLDFLGRTKGPAPTAASLEIAVVQNGDRGLRRTENVPVAGWAVDSCGRGGRYRLLIGSGGGGGSRLGPRGPATGHQYPQSCEGNQGQGKGRREVRVKEANNPHETCLC